MPNLLSASTTITTTLSKGDDAYRRPPAKSLKEALPGMKGLYGKNPVAKMKRAMGIMRLGSSNCRVEALRHMLILQMLTNQEVVKAERTGSALSKKE